MKGMTRRAHRMATNQVSGRARRIGSFQEGTVRAVGVEPSQAEADRVREARAKLAEDFAAQSPAETGRMTCPDCGQRVRAKKDGTPYKHAGC